MESNPQPRPVRTSPVAGHTRVVGFASETSPSSVLRFGGQDSPRQGNLKRALSQKDLPKLGQLRINTGKGKKGALGLKKSKSYADLQQRHTSAGSPPQPQPRGVPIDSSIQQGTATSSPQHSGSSGGRAGPVQIPLQ